MGDIWKGMSNEAGYRHLEPKGACYGRCIVSDLGMNKIVKSVMEDINMKVLVQEAAVFWRKSTDLSHIPQVEFSFPNYHLVTVDILTSLENYLFTGSKTFVQCVNK